MGCLEGELRRYGRIDWIESARRVSIEWMIVVVDGITVMKMNSDSRTPGDERAKSEV